ncbi:MAG: hypothetical protein GEU93_12860 [Propionibacteriales bacterium]|nr:hypothetical protein [Propionibacteriales bacterium]
MGSLLDRSLVATPAWNELGAQAWAAYSRQADLGNGQILYPAAFIGWTALAVAAAVSVRFDHTAPRSFALPVYAQAACMLAAMATTLKAAPIMLDVADIHNTTALQHAFDQFTLWGVYIRGAALGLAFLSALWATATSCAVRQRALLDVQEKEASSGRANPLS